MKQRGSISLLIVFLLTFLTLASTREFKKTLIFGDIITLHKDFLQEYYAAEWVFDQGLQIVKDRYDILQKQIKEGVVKIGITLPQDSPCKKLLNAVEEISLLIKKHKNNSDKRVVLDVLLQFKSKGEMIIMASCLISKLENYDDEGEPQIITSYYTIGTIVQ